MNLLSSPSEGSVSELLKNATPRGSHWNSPSCDINNLEKEDDELLETLRSQESSVDCQLGDVIFSEL